MSDKVVKSKFIKRMGHIFMLIVWVESMMIKLLAAKRNPQCFKKRSFKEITNEIWDYNKDGNFSRLANDFKKEFKPLLSNEDIKLIDDYQAFRDIFGHSIIWANENNAFHNPNTKSRKAKENAFERINKSKSLEINECFIVEIEDDYQDFLDDISKFEEKIFPKISKNLGITNYKSIY